MEMRFGKFLVRKEKKRFISIYDYTDYSGRFITHRSNWRQATKIAKLLNDYYKQGYTDGKHSYSIWH